MDWKTPDNLKTEFISGLTFYKSSKYNICPRYPQKLDLNNIKEDDLLFMNLDYFENFFEYLKQINFSGRFTLVSHNSDRDFSQQMLEVCKKYVKRIYAINCTTQDEIITKIPLGFNDQSTEILDNLTYDHCEKNNLVYVNFKLHHHTERPPCFDYFKDKTWATIEPNIIPMIDFFNKLKTFKYCISPRGTGIDTHRTYESIYFDVVPILKSTEIDDLHENLPVLIIKDWSEITEEFLIDNYDDLYNRLRDWKSTNKDWYLPKYWIK